MKTKNRKAVPQPPAESTTFYYKRHGDLLPAHLWRMGKDGSNRPDLECRAGDTHWRPFEGKSHEQ